jgi:hypothetical protein
MLRAGLDLGGWPRAVGWATERRCVGSFLRCEHLGSPRWGFQEVLQRGIRRHLYLGGMATAWMIRSGRYGERDSWALKHGCSGDGWAEVPDLTNVTTRDQVVQIITDTYPGSDALIANYTGQLWVLRGRVQPGDLLVMPMKTTRQIAIGQVTSGYEYLAAEEDPNCRHVVRVNWQRTNLPRPLSSRTCCSPWAAPCRSLPQARTTP